MPSDHIDPFDQCVEQVFQQALDLEDGAQREFLAAACGGDDALHRAVAELLHASAHADASLIWNEPAIVHEARSTATHEDTTPFERYRLLERIGTGGMGVVYKAVRADDAFSKLVAVKIVHSSAADEQGDDGQLRRFRQERQILAGLEHPNIARLLDGGSTGDGRPFLVMEYVDGAPVDRYVVQKKPPLRDLLELFRKICSAVSYAHRNLVVHRDLKPGNILVTADGEPKLLDFGIAKLLDDSSERTKTGAAAMTPEYASPEQVRGAPITTASDIYSLGVLLYELLSGRRPYRNTSSALDLAQAITTEDPSPLSAAGGRFDRDLETIVRMALRKEPERRYASAEQLSEDIRRFQDGYPIAARPDTRRYRARKFIARNKVLMTAAALVFLTLVAGIAATAWEAHLANHRFNQVRKLANSYLFEFHDAIKDLPGSTKARQLVVKRALEYLDSLAQERGNDDVLQRELANAYERVGNVQGFPRGANLGDVSGARASYKKAMEIRQRLANASPKNKQNIIDLAKSYGTLGAMSMFSGDLKAAVENQRRALALVDKVAVSWPHDAEIRESIANYSTFLGDILGNSNYDNLGDAKGALEQYRKVVPIREKLAAEQPANREERQYLAGVYGRIGQVLQGLNDKAGAVTVLKQALAINEQLLREDPANASYERDVSVGARNLSMALIQKGDLAEAQKYGDRSMQLFEQVARQDPTNTQARVELADSYYAQGFLRLKTNETSEAFRYCDLSLEIYKAVATAHPEVEIGGMRTAYQVRAELAIKTGEIHKALDSAQRELDLDGQLLQANAANASAQRNQGVAYSQIARVHELLAGRARTAAAKTVEWREARSWYQRSLSIWLAQRKNGTLIPGYAGRVDEATKAIAKCDDTLDGSTIAASRE